MQNNNDSNNSRPVYEVFAKPKEGSCLIVGVRTLDGQQYTSDFGKAKQAADTYHRQTARRSHYVVAVHKGYGKGYRIAYDTSRDELRRIKAARNFYMEAGR